MDHFISSRSDTVHGLEDLFLCGLLIDANVADVCEECEVDDACFVLLVVLHELEEAVVLLAIEWEIAVVGSDELHGLPELKVASMSSMEIM